MRKSVSAILVLFLSIHIAYTYQLQSFGVSLFDKEPVPTEKLCYELIRNVSLPNATYVAVPWCVLINHKRFDLLPEHISVDNGVTVCQHIQFETILPALKKAGITTLFNPHAIKGKEYDGIKVLPIAHFPANGIDPAEHKDILYSFVGNSWTHHTRGKIAELPCPDDVNITIRRNYHFFIPPELRQHDQEEYKDILARSRFSLCPRGTGPSTVRFWESLQAGAIPVLFSEEFWLPEAGFDWDCAVLRLTEHDIRNVDSIIRSITPEQEETLRRNCLKAYQHFCGKNFVAPILYHYGIRR